MCVCKYACVSRARAHTCYFKTANRTLSRDEARAQRQGDQGRGTCACRAPYNTPKMMRYTETPGGQALSSTKRPREPRSKSPPSERTESTVSHSGSKALYRTVNALHWGVLMNLPPSTASLALAHGMILAVYIAYRRNLS